MQASTPPLPIPGPLGLGDLLDRAFRLYRARFGPLLLTAAVFLVPSQVVAGLVARWMGRPGVLISVFAFALYYAITLVMVGATYLALAGKTDAILRGSDATLRACAGLALRRLWAYVRMMLAQIVLMSLAMGVVAVPLICGATAVGGIGALLAGGSDGAATAAGLVVLLGFLITIVLVLIPLIYLSARWLAAMPGLALQQWGPVQALRNSWRLTRGNVWRCIGYWLLISLLGYLFASLPVLLFSTLAGALLTGSGAWATIISSLVGSVFSILWYPVSVAALVLLYYDLRVRNEGYDLAVRVEQMAAEVEARYGSVLAGDEDEAPLGASASAPAPAGRDLFDFSVAAEDARWRQETPEDEQPRSADGMFAGGPESAAVPNPGPEAGPQA